MVGAPGPFYGPLVSEIHHIPSMRRFLLRARTLAQPGLTRALLYFVGAAVLLAAAAATWRPDEAPVVAGTLAEPTANIAAQPAEDTAAALYGWGDPIPEGSDEFNYGSEERPAAPDDEKWDMVDRGEDCWPGREGHGQRCESNSRVVGDLLRIVGNANGDTGWIASTFDQQYGRWEARVRSEATGRADSERQYHPLLILWPSSDEHPQDGEYDFLENGEPGAPCAEAFIHYPHDDTAPVQQEPAERCGVNLAQWHNFAIEWTPDHIKGFIDGEEWFSFSGGENAIRECIQCSPGMHQTIQLDNFFGGEMQPAVYEVDWTRAYTL